MDSRASAVPLRRETADRDFGALCLLIMAYAIEDSRLENGRSDWASRRSVGEVHED